MRTHYVCTTGTSVAGKANPMTKHTDAQAYDRAIDQRVAEERGKDGSDDKNFFAEVSAETNSLCTHRLDRKDQVTLLHTQTVDGKICAGKLQSLLRELMDTPPQVNEIAGLQVEDPKKFRHQGIQNLLAAVDKAREQAGSDTQVVLNVTGGFKGVVPYLTLYGLLKQIPVIYLFERSNAVITLPPAPLSFDYERLSRARLAIQSVEQETAVPREEFFKKIRGLAHHEREWFESLLEDAPDFGKDYVTLSAFGLLFSNDVKAQAAMVMLSPAARKQLNESTGVKREQFLFMLQRVGDKLWRAGKQHSFSGTDLSVYKPGNTSERMACIIRDQYVYVCELLGHDEYERILPTRQQANYQLNSFTPWQPAADEVPISSDADLLNSLQMENSSLQSQLSEAQLQHQRAAKILKSLRQQLVTSANGLSSLLAQLDELATTGQPEQ